MTGSAISEIGRVENPDPVSHEYSSLMNASKLVRQPSTHEINKINAGSPFPDNPGHSITGGFTSSSSSEESIIKYSKNTMEEERRNSTSLSLNERDRR